MTGCLEDIKQEKEHHDGNIFLCSTMKTLLHNMDYFKKKTVLRECHLVLILREANEPNSTIRCTVTESYEGDNILNGWSLFAITPCR